MKKLVICIILSVAVLFGSKTHSMAEDLQEHDFHSVLLEHNITVEGEYADFTNSRVCSLIEEVDPSWQDVMQEKYASALQENDRFLTVSPEELLELHFYSLSDRGREEFLKKIDHQKVSVETDKNGDVILISYNPN